MTRIWTVDVCVLQQPAVGQIEGIQLVARRVIRRRVERVEAMPFGFNVRSIGQREPEPAKDPDRLVEQLRERMDGAKVAAASRAA